MEFLIVPLDSAFQDESNRYHILSPHPTKTQFSYHVPMLGGDRVYAITFDRNISES